MGDGVRELEDASDGDGVMLPSSEPLTETVSCSDSSTGSGGALLDDRVLTVGAAAGASARFEGAGLAGVAEARCLGARGGLLASGWKSIIGKSRCSQLYCLQRATPLSRGIQVPEEIYIVLHSLASIQMTHLGIFRNLLGPSHVPLSGPLVREYVYAEVYRNQPL